eukprot:1157490-Pelagomonas_calceolata.AAC.3
MCQPVLVMINFDRKQVQHVAAAAAAAAVIPRSFHIDLDTVARQSMFPVSLSSTHGLHTTRRIKRTDSLAEEACRLIGARMS